MKWFQTTGIYSLPEMIPKIILIFFIFSFIGWLCEVIYVGFIFEHRFINRGFLFGPICPIYGIAGVLMLFFPEKLQHSVILLFFSGVVQHKDANVDENEFDQHCARCELVAKRINNSCHL